MRRFITLIILIATCLGQSDALAQFDRISVQAGISVYPDPNSAPNVYIEFPFSVHRNQFTFLPNDSGSGGLLAGIFAEIFLTDTLGKPVDSSNTYFLTAAKDSIDAQNESVSLFNKLSLVPPPGVYSGKLTVMDAIGKKEGSFLYDRLVIEPVVLDRLHLSTLEFAHKISVVENSSDAADSRLVKNGRYVVPNPMGIISENDTSMYIYAELYNLSFDGSPDDSFTLGYKILNNDGSLYHEFAEFVQSKPGSSSVISNILDIAGMKPGRYTLRLVARDLKSRNADSTSRQFVVFPLSGELPQFVKYVEKNPYDTAGLETRVNLVKFLLAPQQLATLSTLNDSGKMRFIEQFFRDQDPDPSTEKNEFLDDVYGRYLYANGNFSSTPRLNDGWKSDRGRILMQYGRWNDREEIPMPSFSKPLEKWTYYSIQGGVVFIFEDERGFGDYRLVHSTASGEVFSPAWDELLKENMPTLQQ